MTRFIIILFIVTFFTGSCKKSILEEIPKDFISTSSFYKSAVDAEAAVFGFYTIREIYENGALMIEAHSDLALGRGSWVPVSYFNQILDPTAIGRVRDLLWNPYYSIISRANTVLINVPNVEMDETKKKSLLAEARFMRAYSYFNLVRAFGPLPLRITPINDVASIGTSRASVEDVYNLIISDLQIGESDLPVSVGSNTRRPSKWAAKMLLAQVYLTLEQWPEAAAKTDEVIASNQFSLVSVTEPEDFYNIFGTSTSSEDILSLQSTPTIADRYVWSLHQPNIPAYNNSSTGFFTIIPNTNSMIGDAWDDNDLRKSFNMYTEYVNAAGVTVPLPATTPILFKKYIAPDGVPSNSRPLLRYTEAFLIYAEAKTMADGAPSALALERLNMIRRRAYGKDFNSSSSVDYPSGMTKEQFRDSVINERAYEFINEQRRWWDLLRIGKAAEYIGAATGVTFNNARLLFPIPQEEINNNPELSQSDQNPGY